MTKVAAFATASPNPSLTGVRPMHAIAWRRARLSLAAVVLAVGLSTAPALLEQASASATEVEICNSPSSPAGQRITVYTNYWPNGYDLFPGGCRVFNRAGIAVQPGYRWQVRSVPGEFGQCWSSTYSYPSKNHDKYAYRVGC